MTTDFMIPDAESSASFSWCSRYRYALERRWGTSGHVLWIMLNPSTADATKDDATIRRCIGFSRAWGFGGLAVVNLFAFRSTDPRALRTVPDPIGPENDRVIRKHARYAGQVIAAWGPNGRLMGRDRAVLALLDDLPEVVVHCLRVTKDGHPAHPLRLPGSLRPMIYPRRNA